MFLYYDNEMQKFCHCGIVEEADEFLIPLKKLDGELLLKCRKIIPVFKSELSRVENNKERKQSIYRQSNKRIKERKIGEIVCKVSEWRKLYLGAAGSNGIGKKYSLEDAANMIGIAKKTLDDYLLQIRAGKKYGFDFNIHSESKVGILRTFVKMNKDRKQEQ